MFLLCGTVGCVVMLFTTQYIDRNFICMRFVQNVTDVIQHFLPDLLM